MALVRIDVYAPSSQAPLVEAVVADGAVRHHVAHGQAAPSDDTPQVGAEGGVIRRITRATVLVAKQEPALLVWVESQAGTRALILLLFRFPFEQTVGAFGSQELLHLLVGTV